MINCAVWCDPVPDRFQGKTKDEVHDDGWWNDGWRHDDRDGTGLVTHRGGAGARGNRLLVVASIVALSLYLDSQKKAQAT